MSAPDSGLLAAVLFAGGVTAIVAIAMMAVRQHRASQLTVARGVLSLTLGFGVAALAGLAIIALSPVAAQASVTIVGTTTSDSGTITDVQLPTLAHNG